MSFLLGPSSKTRETGKWPRAWLRARDGRATPSFLASRVSRVASRVSHARVLPWLNLKKTERGCSQSTDYVSRYGANGDKRATTKYAKWYIVGAQDCTVDIWKISAHSFFCRSCPPISNKMNQEPLWLLGLPIPRCIFAALGNIIS